MNLERERDSCSQKCCVCICFFGFSLSLNFFSLFLLVIIGYVGLLVCFNNNSSSQLEKFTRETKSGSCFILCVYSRVSDYTNMRFFS